jgi:hypothetical protein
MYPDVITTGSLRALKRRPTARIKYKKSQRGITNKKQLSHKRHHGRTRKKLLGNKYNSIILKRKN